LVASVALVAATSAISILESQNHSIAMTLDQLRARVNALGGNPAPIVVLDDAGKIAWWAYLPEDLVVTDSHIDIDNAHVFEIVLDKTWKEKAVQTVDVTLASRYFERIADHVVAISSKVSYLTTADWSDNDLDD
jgi:c-di-AMP phosphodiesterase-like protein